MRYFFRNQLSISGAYYAKALYVLVFFVVQISFLISPLTVYAEDLRGSQSVTPIPSPVPAPTPTVQSVTPQTTTPGGTATTTQKTASNTTAPQPTYSGVQGTIEKYLCAPSEVSTARNSQNPSTMGYENRVVVSQNDISTCVNKLYRFGLVVAGFGAVFMVALAGYFYMLGGEAGKSKGKELIVGSVAGILIILGTFIFLSQINPDLIRFKPIQPPEINGLGLNLPSCAEIGLGDACVLPSGQVAMGDGNRGGVIGGEKGQCTIANMELCSSWNTAAAVSVCGHESGGNTAIGSSTDICTNISYNGKPFSWSWGLFQINIAAHGDKIPECQNLITKGACVAGYGTVAGYTYCKGNTCSLNAGKTQADINKCVQAITNKERNIQVACQLYQRSCWAPWKASATKSGVFGVCSK